MTTLEIVLIVLVVIMLLYLFFRPSRARLTAERDDAQAELTELIIVLNSQQREIETLNSDASHDMIIIQEHINKIRSLESYVSKLKRTNNKKRK